ncbi:MAG: 4'-phosphopantetheinyl transferase superfamily protein [Bacteroidota bacterium]
MDAFQLHSGIPSLSPINSEDVFVFFSVMGESLQRYNAQQVLGRSELDRLTLYRTLGKRNEFLFGRLFMRKILGKMINKSPREVSILINENKRPYLQEENLQFNLSHSFGGFALIVSPDYAVGVDIEYRKRKISLEDGSHVFMPEEKASMKAKDATAAKEEFLLRWTLKEAIYKAANVGTQLLFNEFELGFDPPKVYSHSDHLDDYGWELGHAFPHSDYILAFAVKNSGSPPLRFHFHQIIL